MQNKKPTAKGQQSTPNRQKQSVIKAHAPKLILSYQKTIRCLDLSQLVILLRGTQYLEPCKRLREAINVNDSISNVLNKLPKIHFGLKEKNAYAGRITLSFKADNEADLECLRKKVNLLPNTLLSFTGSSGKTLKVVVSFLRPDGTLPKGQTLSHADLLRKQTSTNHAVLFHEHALLHAVQVYQMQLGRWPEVENARPESGCRISSDPQTYYNPDAQPIYLEQPTTHPDVASQRHIDSQTAIQTAMPAIDEIAREDERYQWCLMRMQRQGSMPIDLFLTDLAKHCYANDIDDNFALFRLLREPEYQNCEALARSCFQNVYAKHYRSKTKRMPAADMDIYEMETYLKRNYIFRRNELTDEEEYIDRSLYSTRWQPVTEQLLNTIIINLHKQWLHHIWDKDLLRYIRSQYVQIYNPLDEYLEKLPAWDGRDRVSEMAHSIHTANTHWEEDFHTWMLGMVSQWMGLNRKHPVSLTPMLISRQGAGKSTFCRNILPPELRTYYIEHIDFRNNEHAERTLSRYCLINLDEFDKITEHQMTFLKYIQTLRESQTRRMYSTSVDVKRRYAAFIATTNSVMPLRDDSGSRRYLCLSVDSIDQTLRIDYPQLYAQLKAEVRQGRKTYFTAEEEQRIQETNSEFQYLDEGHDLFMEICEKPADKEHAERLTPTDIADRIHDHHKYFKIDHASVTKIGKYLRQLGYPTQRTGGVRYYFVKLKTGA